MNVHSSILLCICAVAHPNRRNNSNINVAALGAIVGRTIAIEIMTPGGTPSRPDSDTIFPV